MIAQHPKEPNVLFAGTEEFGIYVSRNGGKWWDRSEAGVEHPTFYTIAFDPNHPEIMYAGGYTTGVYKSVDGGKSWARKNEGLPLPEHPWDCGGPDEQRPRLRGNHLGRGVPF